MMDTTTKIPIVIPTSPLKGALLYLYFQETDFDKYDDYAHDSCHQFFKKDFMQPKDRKEFNSYLRIFGKLFKNDSSNLTVLRFIQELIDNLV